MARHKRNAFWLCGALLFLPAVLSPAFGRSAEGKVVEEQTGAAVPGAFVVVRWESGGRGRRRNPCFHVESAVTDARGTFRIPAFDEAGSEVADLEPAIIVHKPGYRWSRVFLKRGTTRYLKRAADEGAARLDYLWRMDRVTDCHAGGESRKNLLPLKRALYEEARDIAVTPEQQERVERLRTKLRTFERAYGASGETER